MIFHYYFLFIHKIGKLSLSMLNLENKKYKKLEVYSYAKVDINFMPYSYIIPPTRLVYPLPNIPADSQASV